MTGYETIGIQKIKQKGYDQEYKEKQDNEDDQHRHQQEKEKNENGKYD